MVWPDDRFKRPPQVEAVTEHIALDSVKSGVSILADVGTAKGVAPDGTTRPLELHAKSGMGQLTTDLMTHSLLEEVLVELRSIRAHLEVAGGMKNVD